MTGKTTKRFNWKIPRFAMLGLLVLAGTAALARYAWNAETLSSARPPEVVTIAINPDYVGSCPIIVAHANGYFKNEGIVAVIQAHTSGKTALEAALKGHANLATASEIPIVFAAMNREPISIVATIFRTEKDHGIVGRRDRGVISPSSLRGKRVGVTMGTSGQFVLDVFLNRHKLAPSDVTMRNLRPEELSTALARGDVDAIATWEPFLDVSLKQLGGNGTTFYSEDIYEISFNIAATREYIVRHPQTIKKFLRALVHGARFCEVAATEARALMGAGREINTSRWETLWPSYRFDIALDQGLVLALEDETRWAIANKLTDGIDMPNYLDYIYLDALEAVAPSAVTVIH